MQKGSKWYLLLACALFLALGATAVERGGGEAFESAASHSVEIQGPTEVPANENCTWAAVVSGHQGAPIVYRWFKDSQLLIGETHAVLVLDTGTADFYIDVHAAINDSSGHYARAAEFIQVGSGSC